VRRESESESVPAPSSWMRERHSGREKLKDSPSSERPRCRESGVILLEEDASKCRKASSSGTALPVTPPDSASRISRMRREAARPGEDVLETGGREGGGGGERSNWVWRERKE
jgi:hypothetical protein